jgi:hypothetical protein
MYTKRVQDIAVGRVFYEHDGSASWTDQLALIASVAQTVEERNGADNTRSDNETLYIRVAHDNVKGVCLCVLDYKSIHELQNPFCCRIDACKCGQIVWLPSPHTNYLPATRIHRPSN